MKLSIKKYRKKNQKKHKLYINFIKEIQEYKKSLYHSVKYFHNPHEIEFIQFCHHESGGGGLT